MKGHATCWGGRRHPHPRDDPSRASSLSHPDGDPSLTQRVTQASRGGRDPAPKGLDFRSPHRTEGRGSVSTPVAGPVDHDSGVGHVVAGRILTLTLNFPAGRVGSLFLLEYRCPGASRTGVGSLLVGSPPEVLRRPFSRFEWSRVEKKIYLTLKSYQKV